MDAIDVVVIGGGITGLATAWYVLTSNPAASVVVLEAGPKVGGKVSSVRFCGQDIDAGPDAFLARVPGAVELADELGLTADLVAPATGKAWLWSQGTLHPLPVGLVLGVPSDPDALASSSILSPAGIERALASERSGTAALFHDEDVSVAEGIGVHLGGEVVERLVDPLLGGINASDCNRLSLKSASAELFAAVQNPFLMKNLRAHMVRSRGQIGATEERPVFLTPRTGMHSLVSSLSNRLGSRVRCDTPVTGMARGEGLWQIRCETQVLRAHNVVVAAPASVAASLLRSVLGPLSDELASIRTASVALTLLAYPRDRVALPAGSGMLVVRTDRHLLTAASWWSQKWPHLDTGDQVVIRVSAGRDGDDRFAAMTDEELVRALHNELSSVLSIDARPADAVVTRYPGGFPQYDVGHSARVSRIESLAGSLPGLVLAGASYRGIGLPACVRDAKSAADSVLI